MLSLLLYKCYVCLSVCLTLNLAKTTGPISLKIFSKLDDIPRSKIGLLPYTFFTVSSWRPFVRRYNHKVLDIDFYLVIG